MKKGLLSLMVCALACGNVMAYDGGNGYITCSVDYDYGVQKVVSTQAGEFANFLANSDFNQYMDREDVIFSGPMNTADLQAMTADIWQNVRFLDFSNVTGLTADDIDNQLPSSNNHRACMIVMPKAVDVTPAIVKDVFQARIGGENGNRNYGFFMGGNTGIINVLENLAYNKVFSDFVNGFKYIYSTDETVGGLCFHYSYADTDAANYPTYGGQVSYDWSTSFYSNGNTYATFFDAIKEIPVASLDLSGVYAAAVGYSFANFNPNTHYFVIPINTADATVNFSDESATTQSLIQYTDNVWVVANVKGTKWGDGTTNCPYGPDYRDINTADLKESAVITYVRKAGELLNAGRWASNEIKNSTHNVILGKLNKSDLGNMAIMNNKCMDMSYAEFVDGASAEDLTCTNAQYVALPYNTTKEQVDEAYKKLSSGNLKCVVAFVKTAIDEDKANGVQAVPANTLITYSKEQGQVDHAQFMVKSKDGTRAFNVNNVIMSGHLNAQDICQDHSTGVNMGLVVGTDGHLYYSDKLPEGVTARTDTHGTLFGAVLTMADFTNAIFDQPTTAQLEANLAHCPQIFTAEEKKALMTDMNFNALGNTKMSTLYLPTDASQKVIPADFLGDDAHIQTICIPYNFQYIMDRAFNHVGHYLAHVYTSRGEGDDDLVNDDVVDHGYTKDDQGNYTWGTYTISSNVKYIAVGAFDTSTDAPYGDVYVLAQEAPICEKDAFCSNKYFGNNGFKNYTPVCRENYVNGGSWIAVLHFPNALDIDEKKKYTDVDRRYFLQDETGAVDGDGNPITWPCHTEFMRSWHQALTGYTWNEWSTNRCMVVGDNRYGQIFAVGGQAADIPETQATIDVENSEWRDDLNSYEGDNTVTTYPNRRYTPETLCETCSFAGYVGWHQFLLARSDYFYEHEAVTYKQTPWYSFCIPYNMTREELQRYLGTPDGDMPEVRTLVAVKRNTKKNFIDVIISSDLVSNAKDIELTPFATNTCTVTNNNTQQNYTCMGYKYVDIHTTKDVANDVYVKGGYPYFVRGWIPTSEPMPSNLGTYVLAKAQYKNTDLGNLTNIYNFSQEMYTPGQDIKGYVAMPFFNHTIDAIAKDCIGQDENGNALYEEHFYGNNERTHVPAGYSDATYKYNFVGNYNTSDVFAKYIPAGTYYMGKYRKSSDPDDWEGRIYRSTTKTNNWKPWICVISHNGVASALQKIISETPVYYSNYQQVLPDNLWGANEYGGEFGNDDPAEAKFAIYFEEDYPNSDTVITGIRNIGNAEATAAESKVYTISGQCVGTSTNGLQKGIYVVNGKKMIVE